MPKHTTKLSIPLFCSLCPKHPIFSDISHLLTHISSKGHLSHRFKLQIRAQTEHDARKQLEIFETWYTEHGLDDLLAERLAAKELKKSSNKTRKGSTSVKSEFAKHEDIPNNLSHTEERRPNVPRMHLWSTGPRVISEDAQTAVTDPFLRHETYTTPTLTRRIPNFSQFQTPLLPSGRPLTSQKSDDTEDENELDSSKLKGVYWPGMSLFDSATAEMKRMRNQRKDGTLLAQMRLSSAAVVPTESIFHTDGEFIKTRDIYGPLSDSSPVRTDDGISPKAPSPKKPARRYRVVKRKPSPNIVKVSKRRLMKTTSDLSPTIRYFKPSVDEDNEFQMTTGVTGKPRLGIFRDVDEMSPLVVPRFDNRQLILQPGNPNTMSQSFSGPLQRFPSLAFGKENMQPEAPNRPSSSVGVFPPPHIHDVYNPLLYPNHGLHLPYYEPFSFENDIKPAQSTFHGDFKPLMLHSRGAPNTPSVFDDEDDMTFGV